MADILLSERMIHMNDKARKELASLIDTFVEVNENISFSEPINCLDLIYCQESRIRANHLEYLARQVRRGEELLNFPICALHLLVEELDGVYEGLTYEDISKNDRMMADYIRDCLKYKESEMFIREHTKWVEEGPELEDEKDEEDK